MTMGSQYLVFLILSTIISGCASQGDWIPMRLNTRTSLRIMGNAARYIGITLIREVFALKQVRGSMYRVTLEGIKPFSRIIHVCTAYVNETEFRSTVVAYRCYPPVYY